MSEPMSSVEIEDVLSSIRRLVSEDLRPAARASGVPVPPRPAAPPEGSKLILTPALRVVPTDGTQEEAAVAGTEDTAPAAPQEDAEVAPSDPWDAPAFHSVRHEAALSNPAASAADSVATLGAAMDDLPEAAEWEAEEAGFVEVDDLHAAEIVSLDRFAGEDDAALAADVAEAMGASVDAPVVTMAAPADADWMPEDQAGWDDPDLAAPDPAAPDVAEVVAQVMAPAADPAPQPATEDARAWADSAEAEVLRRLSQDPEDYGFAAGPAAGPDAVYDEELLRELVRDIIREELQGALGERITRNVRKLVRAEISRALAVRDFE